MSQVTTFYSNNEDSLVLGNHNEQSKRQAFTLVELLVVMAALTVLAAVTLPSIKGLLHDQKVTAAARMVKAHLEAAQARAIATGRPVAAILERNTNSLDNITLNTVTRLSIGQVFPPYEGDTLGLRGALSDQNGDGFFDRIAIPVGSATLLAAAVVPPAFEQGDFIQIGERHNLYVIDGISGGVVDFRNPHFEGGAPVPTQEAQLPAEPSNSMATFRLYRKPTKSFLQTTILPRGTCVDLTVSGFGQTGYQFSSTISGTQPIMIVFDGQGRVSYLTNGGGYPTVPIGLIQLLVGRTEQVVFDDPSTDSVSESLAQADPNDPGTLDANINDLSNIWLSVNPYTGAIYTSGLQSGVLPGMPLDPLPVANRQLAERLRAARQFATNAITQSEN